MGVACMITRTPDGSVERVDAPNGLRSRLYADAVAAFGNREKGLSMWAMAYTDGFKRYYGDWQNARPGDMYDLDENGEPRLEDVAKYYERENAVVDDLMPEEAEAIRGAVESMNFDGVESLADAIRASFVVDGTLSVNEATLRESGLYEEDEIRRMVNDPAAMQEARDAMSRVMRFADRMRDRTKSDFYFTNLDEGFVVYRRGSYNALGKQEIYNPAEIDMELREALAGVTTIEEMDEAIYNTGNEDLIDMYENSSEFRDAVFEMYSDLASVPLSKFTGSEVSGTDSRSENILSFATPSAEGIDSVRMDILDLIALSKGEWFSGSRSVKEKLKKIEDGMAKMSIDAVGLSEAYHDYEGVQSAILSISALLNDLRAGNTSNVSTYASAINNVLGGVHESEAAELPDAIRERNPIRVYSSDNASRMYSDYGLIRVGQGLYVRANNDMTTDELYDSISDIYKDDPSAFPSLSSMPASLSDTRDVATLRGNIQRYVRSLTDFYNTEEMILNRIALGLPLTYHESYDAQDEYNKYVRKREMGDREADLPSVYGNYLRHKSANDSLWRSTYQYMKFTPDGIELRTGHEAAGQSIGTNLRGEERMELERVLLDMPGDTYKKVFPIENRDMNLAAFDARADFARTNREQIPEAGEGVFSYSGEDIVAEGRYDEFLRDGDTVYAKISETESGSVYSRVLEGGRENIRKFAETSHPFTNMGLRVDNSSLIEDESSIGKSERERLDSELECKN